MTDEVDDTDMSAAEFRAARSRGTPARVVTSREEFDARSRRGAGTFEVYEDRTGKFRFRLKSANGQTLASGETYATKAAVLQAVEAVREAAQSARVETPVAD